MHGFLDKDYGFHDFSLRFFDVNFVWRIMVLQTHKMTRNRQAKGPPGLPGSAGESGDTGEAGEAQGAVGGSGAEVLKYEAFPTLNPGYTVKIHSIQGYLLGYFDQLSSFSCITLNIQCTKIITLFEDPLCPRDRSVGPAFFFTLVMFYVLAGK